VIPKKQPNKFSRTWPMWTYPTLVLWRFIWLITCSWTPKFLNPWRLIILRLFGAKIEGIPFVHSTARIEIPWHLKLQHRACLGSRVNAYSLGFIEIHQGATVAQEVYLCSGTHDFDSTNFQLVTKPIVIEKDVFIGVRTMVLPGVTIRKGAIIGAQSVVTKNIPPNVVFGGNPAKKIRNR
jgi:putative colanic acid biosynthesis acetyltransferase WcaF